MSHQTKLLTWLQAMANVDKASEKAYQRYQHHISEEEKTKPLLSATHVPPPFYFSNGIQQNSDAWMPQFEHEAVLDPHPVTAPGDLHAAHKVVDVFMPEYHSPSTYDTISNDFYAQANNGRFDLDLTHSFLSPPEWHPTELDHLYDVNMEWDSSELLGQV